MRDSITPQRVANAILQDNSYSGGHLLVEGETDIKLYRKFTNTELSKVNVCFGKDRMREVHSILLERGFNKMAGIRDADFIRVNGKFSDDYNESIFITDCHDSEGMIFKSDAFFSFLTEVVKTNHLDDFMKNKGCIRKYIYELANPIACLRLANKRFNLGLAFKPASQEGNTIKFKKFICEKTASYLGHEKLINTVVEYSSNRGSVISDRKTIIEKLEEILALKLSIEEVSNGHDLAEITYMICSKILKSNHPSLKNSASVESMLRLSFSKIEFSKTCLHSKLHEWQKINSCNIINS